MNSQELTNGFMKYFISRNIPTEINIKLTEKHEINISIFLSYNDDYDFVINYCEGGIELRFMLFLEIDEHAKEKIEILEEVFSNEKGIFKDLKASIRDEITFSSLYEIEKMSVKEFAKIEQILVLIADLLKQYKMKVTA